MLDVTPTMLANMGIIPAIIYLEKLNITSDFAGGIAYGSRIIEASKLFQICIITNMGNSKFFKYFYF